MSTQANTVDFYLNSIKKCMNTTLETLELLSNTPFLRGISSTTRALLKDMEVNFPTCLLVYLTYQMLDRKTKPK
jgi:hypothetical protein